MALAALFAGAGLAGHVLAGPAQRGAEPGPESVTERARQIDRALSATRPPLPEGMPTAKPRIGKPFDALTPGEIGYARWLAVRHQKNPGRRVDGSTGYEFLAAAASAEPGGRKVAVTSYDYAANVQVLQVADLVTGAVTERTGGGVQAPPSGTEQIHALHLLLTSPAGAPIREAYRRSTNRNLTSPAQLDVNAGALLNPPATGDGAACAVDRCVTFQGRVRDGAWLYFGDLAVDLTARTVRVLS
ncbi:hypothetical protein Areg01_66500 [Actinoplanes regularis]|nr:hypothetical protein Areg01_66500 [Actinoplanes regularis]